MKQLFCFLSLIFLIACSSQPITTTPSETTETPQVTTPETVDLSVTTSSENKTELVLFKTKSTYKWLIDAVACANKVINSEQFKKQMSGIESFTYASKTINGNVVLDRINGTKIINARTYYKRFTNAVAYSYYDLGDIYLNTKTQPWKVYEIVETLVHETTHVYGFAHGNNYPDGKGDSVPYKTGSIAGGVAKELCK